MQPWSYGPPEIRAPKLVKYVKSRERASLPAVYRSTADAHRPRWVSRDWSPPPCQQCGALIPSLLIRDSRTVVRFAGLRSTSILIVSYVCDINIRDRSTVGNAAIIPQSSTRVCLRQLYSRRAFFVAMDLRKMRSRSRRTEQ